MYILSKVNARKKLGGKKKMVKIANHEELMDEANEIYEQLPTELKEQVKSHSLLERIDLLHELTRLLKKDSL